MGWGIKDKKFQEEIFPNEFLLFLGISLKIQQVFLSRLVFQFRRLADHLQTLFPVFSTPTIYIQCSQQEESFVKIIVRSYL